jgi:hypothetical protein
LKSKIKKKINLTKGPKKQNQNNEDQIEKNIYEKIRLNDEIEN